MSIYSIKNLSFSYPLKETLQLDNINLDVNQGEFVVICGKSGCGKSTLLRHLKTVLTPHGNRRGKIYFKSKELEDVDTRTQSSKIGCVLQSPDNQIVTDKVWHELAFGLESLGYDNNTIRLRVSEMASFFGIQSWFMKNVSELSGGQKQILNLASIMVMQPDVLILDEPTSQLDPIASSEFLQIIKKINIELGTTVIITEHDLEEVFKLADKIIVIDNGRIIIEDETRCVGSRLRDMNHEMFIAMPTPIKIALNIDKSSVCPINVKEGRKWLKHKLEGIDIKDNMIKDKSYTNNNDIAVSIKDIYFRYEKNSSDIVKGLSLDVKKGQFYCIVGGNGTGKTTALSLISGINRGHRGSIEIFGKNIRKYSNKDLFDKNIALLPQSPQALFVKKTVELELYEMLSYRKLSKGEKKAKIDYISKLVELEELLSMHPYDLSGGEQQKAALAKVLLLEPRLLLLDEPTKGLDASFKIKFAKIINKLLQQDVTIVMVSHDIEFCAKYAHKCALFFNGSIITSDNPNKFFSGNSFYTTVANRMSRDFFKNAVTCEDVINLWDMNNLKSVSMKSQMIKG
ncbi:ABC transporter ATP-binding protein [Paraclostridium sordellii]|uniref:Cobalt ABC transporter ATPase n=1 Tax=Paraclostridium sordellii TaxID=1505 RepID=A0A0C7QRK6_PARSO|nr:ATP-binding cassette domain-containing protein [Paeniclostridium sordellii]CEN78191.1 cobalt ABC transporter ATPase [[Clostridium] sordellii] [Paeniclostridium sordellii]CEQ03277.1 cobalt ABC transporter ATPase [[Clostridium] sordellii] [Paeniclostridium sordellii]